MIPLRLNINRCVAEYISLEIECEKMQQTYVDSIQQFDPQYICKFTVSTFLK